MLSVLRQYALPLHFPKPVLEEADAIARTRVTDKASDEDLKGRVDCRSHRVVTIDPDDAKDFDDAICLTNTEQGQWKLWVISPMSPITFVPAALWTPRPGDGAIRPTSWTASSHAARSVEQRAMLAQTGHRPPYQVRRVPPIQRRNGAGNRFYPAVIRSQRRFTYKEVFERPPTGARRSHRPHADTRRTTSPSASAAPGSKPVRWTSILSRLKSVSTSMDAFCALKKSRTMSLTNWSKNICYWPTRPLPPG